MGRKNISKHNIKDSNINIYTVTNRLKTSKPIDKFKISTTKLEKKAIWLTGGNILMYKEGFKSVSER